MTTAIDKVSAALRDIADRTAEDIKQAAGQAVPFSLFVWTHGRCSYIATADRPEVVQVLEGMIARWRKGMPDIPAHEADPAGDYIAECRARGLDPQETLAAALSKGTGT